MANKQYIERLQMVIHQLHRCDSIWVESAPVHEVFNGQTVWKGHVEVFTLSGHPKAKKAYAWSHPEGPDDTGERFVAVLEIPPVESPVTAVRASIVADSKKQKAKPKCPPDKHNWKFFDSFPGYEIFDCQSCGLRKFVDSKTGKETFE